MNLHTYYARIRDIEDSIADDSIVIKSLATEAGGVAGRLTEVSRTIAARMVVDGLAEIASPAEAKRHRADAISKRQAEEERRRAAQVHFTVISEADLKSLPKSLRGSRE